MIFKFKCDFICNAKTSFEKPKQNYPMTIEKTNGQYNVFHGSH